MDMGTLFPAHKDNADALDLVCKMLDFHPVSRISVDTALQHPFLASLHNPEDEPVADFTFSFDFENEELSRERIQELIWEEIRQYHPDIPEQYPSATNKRRGRGGEAKAEGKDNDESVTPVAGTGRKQLKGEK
jgi:serine/threonine protein kinase